MPRPSSIRLSDNLVERVDRLAAALERPRSWVIERAIATYLDDQEWQVAKIRAALDDVRAGTANFIPHDQVVLHVDAMIEEAIGARPEHEPAPEHAPDRVA